MSYRPASTRSGARGHECCGSGTQVDVPHERPVMHADERMFEDHKVMQPIDLSTGLIRKASISQRLLLAATPITRPR
jgi:hypothetical protein